MNILGHSWIAVNAIPGKRDLLIIGSLLPESFPFIKDNPFSFEEIHEGGERLLEFLDRSYPGRRDLALGMLAHGKKFGADGFNQEIEKYADERREEFLQKIAACSAISLKFAGFRLHNFLWWGVDVWILKKYPEFVGEVQAALRKVDVEGISTLLAEAFEKEQSAVEKVIETLLKRIYRPEDLTSVEGLARTWARQAAGLPEKDRVNVAQTTTLFEECADLLKNDWRNIIGLVETRVGKNLRRLIEKMLY